MTIPWKGSSVTRLMPTQESVDLMAMVEEFAGEGLAPRAAQAEEDSEFARDVFTTMGELGLLGLPFDEQFGGGGQPYEVYLQVLEEIAARWAAVAQLAGGQWGVVDDAALGGLGIGRSAVHRAVVSRRLRRVHSGVYVVGAGPLSREARRLAAVRRRIVRMWSDV